MLAPSFLLAFSRVSERLVFPGGGWVSVCIRCVWGVHILVLNAITNRCREREESVCVQPRNLWHYHQEIFLAQMSGDRSNDLDLSFCKICNSICEYSS